MRAFVLSQPIAPRGGGPSVRARGGPREFRSLQWVRERVFRERGVNPMPEPHTQDKLRRRERVRLDRGRVQPVRHGPACGGCRLPARPGASAGTRLAPGRDRRRPRAAWIESARSLLRAAGWRVALYILRSRTFGRNDAAVGACGPGAQQPVPHRIRFDGTWSSTARLYAGGRPRLSTATGRRGCTAWQTGWTTPNSRRCCMLWTSADRQAGARDAIRRASMR